MTTAAKYRRSRERYLAKRETGVGVASLVNSVVERRRYGQITDPLGADKERLSGLRFARLGVVTEKGGDDYS